MKKVILIIVGVVIVLFVLYFIGNHKYEYHLDYGYLDNISYNISDEFEGSDSSRGYYHYYGDNSSCSFSVDNFYVNSNYKDAKDYLRNNLYFTLNDKVSEIEEVSLNGYQWYYLKKEDDGGVTYYYATIKGDTGYVLEYDINDYNNGDYNKDDYNLCYMEYDRIISSVRFK